MINTKNLSPKQLSLLTAGILSVPVGFGAMLLRPEWELVLITFVGEAVREAFDPKKFTYYR